MSRLSETGGNPVTIGALTAAADLKKQRYSDLVTQISIAAVLQSRATDGYDCPALRSLSNLIGHQWPDVGLPSYGWWLPRRSDARRLFGRAMTAGSAPAGGNTIVSASVQSIAAASRPLLTLDRAGAVRFEVDNTADSVLPEWNPSSGAGYWVQEGEAVTSTSLTLLSGVASPHTCGVSTDISRRLILQAETAEPQILAELQRLVAYTTEQGLWTGTNTNGEPLGILSTPGAETVPFAGATPTYAELVEMFEAYSDNNGDPTMMTFFCHPKLLSALMTTEVASGTGNFAASCIHGPRQVSLFGILVFPTRCIPDGKVVLCDPSNLAVVYWRSPQLISNPFALDTQGGRRLTILNDLDVVVRRRNQLVIGA